MKIGELASRANLKPSAIRYYERMGILEAPHRVSGQRRYPIDALDRVRLIRRHHARPAQGSRRRGAIIRAAIALRLVRGAGVLGRRAARKQPCRKENDSRRPPP